MTTPNILNPNSPGFRFIRTIGLAEVIVAGKVQNAKTILDGVGTHQLDTE